MKKKKSLIISIIFGITTLTGIPYVFNAIQEHGLAGVNYGRIIFPLIISAVAFLTYKKK